MKLDVRLPIGLLFSTLGVILAAFGGATNGNAALYSRSLGFNVNEWSGVAMLVFGLGMFHFGRRAQRRLTPPVEVDRKRHPARGKR